MEINYAIYGERNGGHAFLGSSGNLEIATRLTQFTDRPGTPSLGMEWGPITSAFPFEAHYIFLRTLPDKNSTRAGMVRSYAAFAPFDQLNKLGSIASIFSYLPSNLDIGSQALEPILISTENTCRDSNTTRSIPGLIEIAHRLCSQETQFPLVWSTSEDYLLLMDEIWRRLPESLRPIFSFSFQFAPEHKLPSSPIIVVTSPSLVNRWEASLVVSTQNAPYPNLTKTQEWFLGLGESSEFVAMLSEFDIALENFKDLSMLASFAELVSKLPFLSFPQLRKVIRILEKFSLPPKSAREKRSALFRQFCSSVAVQPPNEIETLRNLNPKRLHDLIPTLQDALRDWWKKADDDIVLLSERINILELSVATPENWWSIPFLEWLQGVAKIRRPQDAEIIVQLIFLSKSLTEFIENRIPAKKSSELSLIQALPTKINNNQKDSILALSLRRNWMKLHATCLIKSDQRNEAIIVQSQVAGSSTVGFDILYQEFGFFKMLDVACSTCQSSLIDYLSSKLVSEEPVFIDQFDFSMNGWLDFLTYVVEIAPKPFSEYLRKLIILSIENNLSETVQTLLLRCVDLDPAVILGIKSLSVVLGRLEEARRKEVIEKLRVFINTGITNNTDFIISDPDFIRSIISTSDIQSILEKLDRGLKVAYGLNAFRRLHLLDDDFRDWLIKLFTATQFSQLNGEEIAAISSFMLPVDFPLSAKIICETALKYKRADSDAIFQSIRYKYEMSSELTNANKEEGATYPKIVIATALPLERNSVMRKLTNVDYSAELCADRAFWPEQSPLYEIFLILTGPGNLDAQSKSSLILEQVKPDAAFFVGVCGGVKDNNIGDVVYSTKVYYVEGGKEDDTFKSRPQTENTNEKLVQLTHRVAEKKWQPEIDGVPLPKASPAVFACGEKVLASTGDSANQYKQIRSSYNDAQIIDMETFGFLKATRNAEVKFSMSIRGVSDRIQGKAEADSKGNQPLAANNAAAFLFAILRELPALLPKKEKKSLWPSFEWL